MDDARLVVKNAYEEFLVYAIDPTKWDRFIRFYNGEDVDEHGHLIPGIREWLLERGVHVADAWSITLSNCVLFLIAVDIYPTDWVTIGHLRNYLLNNDFLQIREQPAFQIPRPQ